MGFQTSEEGRVIPVGPEECQAVMRAVEFDLAVKPSYLIVGTATLRSLVRLDAPRLEKGSYAGTYCGVPVIVDGAVGWYARAVVPVEAAYAPSMRPARYEAFPPRQGS